MSQSFQTARSSLSTVNIMAVVTISRDRLQEDWTEIESRAHRTAALAVLIMFRIAVELWRKGWGNSAAVCQELLICDLCARRIFGIQAKSAMISDVAVDLVAREIG